MTTWEKHRGLWLPSTTVPQHGPSGLRGAYKAWRTKQDIEEFRQEYMCSFASFETLGFSAGDPGLLRNLDIETEEWRPTVMTEAFLERHVAQLKGGT